MTKHPPASAFPGKTLTKAPDTDTHPLAPKTPPPPPAGGDDGAGSKFPQFSARVHPDLLRQVKIRVATRGTTLQAATAAAFKLWLEQTGE